MKTLKSISFVLLMFLVMTSFSQCSSSKSMMKTTPLALEQAYFQKWVAGIQGGGSGLDLYIPTADNNKNAIAMDSVYFRGKVCKLEAKMLNDKLVYVGHFVSSFNQLEDKVPGTENNSQPKVKPLAKIPFELKDNECVVSVINSEETTYFKIENIVEKQSVAFPSAPPNNN